MILENQLPAPRLELRWEVTSPDASRWRCNYNLVLPLGEHDIRRERKNADGEFEVYRTEQTVELGYTNITSAPGHTPHRHERIDTPFRDGAHAKWDSAVLGNLPIYAVCGGIAMLVEAGD